MADSGCERPSETTLFGSRWIIRRVLIGREESVFWWWWFEFWNVRVSERERWDLNSFEMFRSNTPLSHFQFY